MATINQHVSAIRQLLKQYQKDTTFTNELLYFHLMNAAAIVNVRKAEKYYKLSDWNTPSFCIGTIVTKEHPCECINAGCELIRTKYKIPRPLTGKHRDLLTVSTLDNKVIPKIKPEMVDVYMTDEIKKMSLFYFMLDEYIFIVNGNVTVGSPKALLIKGFWEDISDWVGIKACDKDGKDTDKDCFIMDDFELPIDRDYVYMAWELTFQFLGIPMKIKSDDLNNLNPEL